MPSPTATKGLSLYLANLRSLISQSSTWQTWTGNPGNAAIAINSVYLIGVTPPSVLDGNPDNQGYTAADWAKIRPFCVINYDLRNGYEAKQEGQGFGGSAFVETARILFSFEDTIDPANAENYSDQVIAFLENVGGVIDDLKASTGVDSNINFHTIRLEGIPKRSDQTENATRGDYLMVIFSAEAGI